MSCKLDWCSSSVSLQCLSDCVVVISHRYVWCYSSISLFMISHSVYIESCSDGITEPLISGSTYRVQDEFLEADSHHNGFPPQDGRHGRRSWCESSGSSERPWFQVTFGVNVNISVLQMGGYNGFRNHYITRFEIHIGDDGTEESLHPLTTSEDSAEPLVRC